jgi:hypothetical protein
MHPDRRRQYLDGEERRFREFMVQEAERRRLRYIVSNFYTFYILLLQFARNMDALGGCSSAVQDPYPHLDSCLDAGTALERIALLRRCHVVFSHFIVSDAASISLLVA